MNIKVTALCVVICGVFSSAVGVPLNWADLEKSLGKDTDEPFDRHRLLSVLVLQNANIRTNTRVLTEMATQTDYPLTAMAGLWRLRELDSNLAYRISFQHLWKSTNIASPFGLPFLECITNTVGSNLFRSAFSAVVLSEANDRKTPIIVINQIPVNNLVNWLMSPESKSCAVTIEALVVDRLLSVVQNQF